MLETETEDRLDLEFYVRQFMAMHEDGGYASRAKALTNVRAELFGLAWVRGLKESHNVCDNHWQVFPMEDGCPECGF